MNDVTIWKDEGLRQGVEEGKEAGRQIGRQIAAQSIALRMWRRRFRAISEALEARIQSLTLQQTEDLAEAILDFHALSDFEDWFAHRRIE